MTGMVAAELGKFSTMTVGKVQMTLVWWQAAEIRVWGLEWIGSRGPRASLHAVAAEAAWLYGTDQSCASIPSLSCV